ncbi:hypothetical protein [Dyadobacter chenwenxiniae]|nr:hypothetical protein [Dyadobacter chenwenxiniae]
MAENFLPKPAEFDGEVLMSAPARPGLGGPTWAAPPARPDLGGPT